MFQKAFTKYARAVSDGYERNRLYKLFVARQLCAFFYLALCIAVIVAALLLDDAISQEKTAPILIFGLIITLWFFGMIATIVLFLVFRSAYRKILDRAPSENEMPEVTSYRQKTRAANKSLWKAMRWSVALLVAGIAFLLAAIVTDVIQHPESEEPSVLSMVGIVIMGVCALVFALTLMFTQMKRTAAGKTAEMQTEQESKRIDEAQGRKHTYSIAEDNNAQTFRYLFPNPIYFEKMQTLSKKQMNVTILSLIFSMIAGFAVFVLFFSPWVFDWELIGFAFPVFETIVFLGALLPMIPILRRQNALEKMQKEELETYPIYAKNLELYRKYDKFCKVKAKTPFLMYFASVALGYGLAIAFPHSSWSLFAVAPLFAGIISNNVLLSALRRQARPLEDEIDRFRAAVKFRFSEDDPARYQNKKAALGADGTLTCRFVFWDGLFSFGIDGAKRIAEITPPALRLAERKVLASPENITVGGLYLDGEDAYPEIYKQELPLARNLFYDPDRKLLQVGEQTPGAVYKIFQNVLVQLTDEGAIGCILFSDI